MRVVMEAEAESEAIKVSHFLVLCVCVYGVDLCGFYVCIYVCSVYLFG